MQAAPTRWAPRCGPTPSGGTRPSYRTAWPLPWRRIHARSRPARAAGWSAWRITTARPFPRARPMTRTRPSRPGPTPRSPRARCRAGCSWRSPTTPRTPTHSASTCTVSWTPWAPMGCADRGGAGGAGLRAQGAARAALSRPSPPVAGYLAALGPRAPGPRDLCGLRLGGGAERRGGAGEVVGTKQGEGVRCMSRGGVRRFRRAWQRSDPGRSVTR